MDDEFFVSTSEDPATLLERDETKRIGVYKLVGYTTVKNETTVGPTEK